MSEPTSKPAAPVVLIEGVTRRFGSIAAMDDVTLSVPRGAVFGLVGVNGAGKTTLLKHVLGFLKAHTGSVGVFGMDPVADPVGVLSRIGYLSEDNDLPGWMRIDELLRYTRAFYPNWDDAYAERLRQSFELTPTARIEQQADRPPDRRIRLSDALLPALSGSGGASPTGVRGDAFGE